MVWRPGELSWQYQVIVYCLLASYSLLLLLSVLFLGRLCLISHRLTIPKLFFALLVPFLAGRVCTYVFYPDVGESTRDQDPFSIIAGSLPGYVLFSAMTVMALFLAMLVHRVRERDSSSRLAWETQSQTFRGDVGFTGGPDMAMAPQRRKSYGSVPYEAWGLHQQRGVGASGSVLQSVVVGGVALNALLFWCVFGLYWTLLFEWYYGSRWRAKWIWHPIEAAFASLLSAAVMGVFILYGAYLLRLFRREAVSRRLRRKLLRLVAIAVVCTGLLAIRGITVLVQLAAVNSRTGSTVLHVFDAVMCDLMPTLLMLLIVRESGGRVSASWSSSSSSVNPHDSSFDAEGAFADGEVET